MKKRILKLGSLLVATVIGIGSLAGCGAANGTDMSGKNRGSFQ